MHFLLNFEYHHLEWHIPLAIPFCTIYITSASVTASTFKLVFLKDYCHANSGAGWNFADEVKF